MITKVTVFNPPVLGSVGFEMPVLVPDINGLFIEHIDGLGPVDEAITTKAFGSGDGEYFVSRDRGKRNLVFRFGFESRGYNVTILREALVRSFTTTGTDKLNFKFEFDDRDPVQIDGYLETMEDDRFTSDLELALSVICPRPNFLSTEMSLATGTSDHDPDLTDLISAGNRVMGMAIRLIPLVGHEDHFANEIIYESKVEQSPGVYTKINTLSVNGQSDDLPTPMTAGEEFWVDTRLGKKSVYIYTPSTGGVRNALRGMDSSSSWPRLHPGTTKFSITIPYWAQGVHPMDWTVYWYDEFGSI